MSKVGDLDIESKVFEITKEMLIHKGVKGWNMDELSDACGVSKRTLYKIIGNKEDLLLKVSKSSITNDYQRRNAFLFSDKPYPEILDAFSECMTEGFDEFVLLNATHIVKEYPRIGDMIEEEKGKLAVLLAQFLKKGQDEGFVQNSLDVKLVSQFIQNIVTFNIHSCKSALDFKKQIVPELSIVISGIRV